MPSRLAADYDPTEDADLDEAAESNADFRAEYLERATEWLLADQSGSDEAQP